MLYIQPHLNLLPLLGINSNGTDQIQYRAFFITSEAPLSTHIPCAIIIFSAFQSSRWFGRFVYAKCLYLLGIVRLVFVDVSSSSQVHFVKLGLVAGFWTWTWTFQPTQGSMSFFPFLLQQIKHQSHTSVFRSSKTSLNPTESARKTKRIKSSSSSTCTKSAVLLLDNFNTCSTICGQTNPTPGTLENSLLHQFNI